MKIRYVWSGERSLKFFSPEFSAIEKSESSAEAALVRGVWGGKFHSILRTIEENQEGASLLSNM